MRIEVKQTKTLKKSEVMTLGVESESLESAVVEPTPTQQMLKIFTSEHQGLHPVFYRNLMSGEYGQVKYFTVIRNLAYIYFGSNEKCKSAEAKIRESLASTHFKTKDVQTLDTPPNLLEQAMGVAKFPWIPISDNHLNWTGIPMTLSQAKKLVLTLAGNMSKLGDFLAKPHKNQLFKLEESDAKLDPGEWKGVLWQPTDAKEIECYSVVKDFVSIYKSSSDVSSTQNIKIQFSIEKFWDFIEKFKKAHPKHEHALLSACRTSQVLVAQADKARLQFAALDPSPEVCLFPIEMTDTEVRVGVMCYPQVRTLSNHIIYVTDVSGSMSETVDSVVDDAQYGLDEFQRQIFKVFCRDYWKAIAPAGMSFGSVESFEKAYREDYQKLIDAQRTKIEELEKQLEVLRRQEPRNEKAIETAVEQRALFQNIINSIVHRHTWEKSNSSSFWEIPGVKQIFAAHEDQHPTKLYFTKKAGKDALINYKDGTFQLITFSDICRAYSSEDTTEEAFDHLEAGGSTYYKQPVLEALRVCRNNPDKACTIVFTTDGLPYDFKDAKELADQVTAWKEEYKDTLPMRVIVLGAGLGSARDQASLLLHELLNLGREPGLYQSCDNIRLLPNVVKRAIEPPSMQESSVMIFKLGEEEYPVPVKLGEYNCASFTVPRSACQSDGCLSFEGYPPLKVSADACVQIEKDEFKAALCEQVNELRTILQSQNIDVTNRANVQEEKNQMILKALYDVYQNVGEKYQYAARFLKDILDGKYFQRAALSNILMADDYVFSKPTVPVNKEKAPSIPVVKGPFLPLPMSFTLSGAFYNEPEAIDDGTVRTHAQYKNRLEENFNKLGSEMKISPAKKSSLSSSDHTKEKLLKIELSRYKPSILGLTPSLHVPSKSSQVLINPPTFTPTRSGIQSSSLSQTSPVSSPGLMSAPPLLSTTKSGSSLRITPTAPLPLPTKSGSSLSGAPLTTLSTTSTLSGPLTLSGPSLSTPSSSVEIAATKYWKKHKEKLKSATQIPGWLDAAMPHATTTSSVSSTSSSLPVHLTSLASPTTGTSTTTSALAGDAIMPHAATTSSVSSASVSLPVHLTLLAPPTVGAGTTASDPTGLARPVLTPPGTPL